jgi:aryl-alcohol dehydrogenase-like predicted oxidoreductase
MKYVELGGRQVSAIGLGAWQLGSYEWGWAPSSGPEEARRIVHRALDLGINFFDTAEIYGRGRSEALLGDALRGHDEAIVATKVWPTRISATAVVAAARSSLERLGRQVLDLYQIHWPNPLVPLAWPMRGMRELVAAGMVRQVGVSNFGLDRWRRAEALMGGYGSPTNQVRYHLLHREPERKLIPYAESAGRVVIAYSPLAQGLLSGRFGSGQRPRGARARNPYFWPENVRRAQPVVEAVQEVARGRGATPSQVTLAWTIRSGRVIAIPGASRVEQVEENAAAADLELEPEEMRRLDEAAHAFHRASIPRALVSAVRP